MPPLWPELVELDYTNWRGVRRIRRVLPFRIEFGATDRHRERQWLLVALDTETGETRSFALRDVHAWAPTRPAIPAVGA